MHAPNQHLPFVYLKIGDVCAAVGFSVSVLYARIAASEFPAGDLIGKQSRRWKSTDIAAWLNEQSAKSAQRNAELAGPLKRKADKAALNSAAARAKRATLAAGGAN